MIFFFISVLHEQTTGLRKKALTSIFVHDLTHVILPKKYLYIIVSLGIFRIMGPDSSCVGDTCSTMM